MRSVDTIRGITVVGAGAVGSSLAAALFDAGIRIDFVIDPNRERAETAAARSDAAAQSEVDASIAVSDVVLIAVSDKAIPSVASAGTGLTADFSHQIWLHTAGALSASVLAPIVPLIRGTGGFHPAAAFPPRRITPLPEGTLFGVDGNGPALEMTNTLAKTLGGRAVQIPAESRTLYHAACVLSSNAVIGLISEAARTLASVGIAPEDIERLLVTLARCTLDNAADLGLEAALTGPVQRGDADTVSRHLAALESHEDAAALYRVTANAILKTARASGTVDNAAFIRISNIISGKANPS